MTKSKVWVRSLGENCRVGVDDLASAGLVLNALSQTDVLKGLTSVTLSVELKSDQMPGASRCTFMIPGSQEQTLATLEDALSQISGVELMLEPGR